MTKKTLGGNENFLLDLVQSIQAPGALFNEKIQKTSSLPTSFLKTIT